MTFTRTRAGRTLTLPAVLFLLGMAGNCLADPLLAVVARGDGAVNLYRPRGIGLQLLKSVPIGAHPNEMCLDPNGKRLFVVEGGTKSLAVVDLASQSVTGTMTDPAIKSPDGCAVSPDSAKLYVVDTNLDVLFVFSTESRKLLAQIPVGKQPRRPRFSPDGKMLLVSNAHGNTISVIDPASSKVTRTIKTGTEPRELVWTPDGKFLVVTLIGDDCLQFFKGDTLEFVQQVSTERSPQRIAITPDGQLLFAVSRYENAVAVSDISAAGERRYVTSIPVGQLAFNMTMSPDGKYVYTAQSGIDNTISIIDVRLMKVVNTMTAGKDPFTMLYIK